MNNYLNNLYSKQARNEIDFKSKQDQTVKLISNLKSDIDSLNSNLQEKNIELQELKADSVTLNEVTQHRAIEANRLKNEVQGNFYKQLLIKLSKLFSKQRKQQQIEGREVQTRTQVRKP